MSEALKYYFGIDFGTTSSATVSYAVMNHRPMEFQYGDDGRPIPSVVAIDKNTGEVYTGREAWDKKMELSESCVYISSVKTILDLEKTWLIGTKEWTPVDVAAELFKTLKKSVKDRTDVDMNTATVAIPVGFSPKKREKLREAALKAGIKIQSFISEPTAAFFANYTELKSASNIAVFDWGGGTLDISVLQHTNGRVTELATNGKSVAGDEIDDKIAHRIHAKIARKKEQDVSFEDMPPKAQDMMRVRAERAKRALADDDTAVISLGSYGQFGVCRETIDYAWFADIVEPEVSMAMSLLDETIRQSGLGISNIDQILMVGGSSNLGPLQDEMEKKYGDKLFYPDETMWNVAQGAARLAMTPGAYHSSQSIGLVLSDESYYELLSPDTSLGKWKRTCHFGIVDSSKEARFIFGGSPDIEKSSDKYKTLEIPAYRFLQEQIILDAVVDDDMVFKVCARSNMRPAEFSRVWEYPNLKCYYKLPEKQDY